MKAGVRCVLVLDRDAGAAAQLERALSENGYWVKSAADPQAAVHILRENEADLVLVEMSQGVLDVVPRWERRKTDPQPASIATPTPDGYAILRSMPSDPSLARYSAVFITDRNGHTDRHDALRLGVVGYVPKPVTPRALATRMQAATRDLRLSSKLLAHPPLPPGEKPGNLSLCLDGDSVSGWGVPASPFEWLPKALRKALILDPDEGYRAFVHELLAAQGFTVLEASDGQEALPLALEKRPWLLITDVVMPEGEGFEFCRAVRCHSLISHTPLIFLSAWDGYRERHHAAKLGADEYVSKQASNREILIRIEMILSRYSGVDTRTHRGAGMAGEIELSGVPGILQMCHLSQVSGVFTAQAGTRSIEIRFRDGEIISAEAGRLRAALAVYEFLTWSSGHFEFFTRDPGPGAPLRQSFEALLLEGCRRLDEAREHSVAVPEMVLSAPGDPPQTPGRREPGAQAVH